MTIHEFIALPALVFVANFLVGYIMLALFAFAKKSIW